MLCDRTPPNPMVASDSIRRLSRRLLVSLVGFSFSLALTLGLPDLYPVQADTAPPQTTLVMGTEADYIPFEFRYASDPPEDIVGFDIALAQAITRKLGVRLQIQERNFDQLIPALQAGELDFVMAALTPTPERQQLVDFSQPYFESRQALISRRTHPVRTLSDLSGQRVAVQRGTIQEQAMQTLVQQGVEVTVQSFDHINDMITAVREQQVDAALVEELVGEAYLDNNPTLAMDVLGEIPPMPVAIAFPQGSAYLQPVNQVLQEMAANGDLERMARRWFTAQP